MRTDTPQPISLADYQAPDYLIDEVHLDFEHPDRSFVILRQDSDLTE